MPTPDDHLLPSPDPTTGPTLVPNLVAGRRIGDDERDRAVSALSEHYSLGRLDRAELDVRLEAAYRATAVDQLVALFRDLPDPAPFRPDRRERRAAARAARRAGRGGPDRWAAGIPVVPVAVLVLVGFVLVFSQGHAFFLLPMMWLWLGMGRRWYHHPPRR